MGALPLAGNDLPGFGKSTGRVFFSRKPPRLLFYGSSHVSFSASLEPARVFVFGRMPSGKTNQRGYRVQGFPVKDTMSKYYLPNGCGSKQMVPFWGGCTTHFGLF